LFLITFSTQAAKSGRPPREQAVLKPIVGEQGKFSVPLSAL
jgi:hypothetical protein